MTGERLAPDCALRHAVSTAEEFRLFCAEMRDNASISRLFKGKPDWRERTALAVGRFLTVFSGRHMRSRVSRSAQGECNAIRIRGFSHSELTFANTVEAAWSDCPCREKTSWINQSTERPESDRCKESGAVTWSRHVSGSRPADPN